MHISHHGDSYIRQAEFIYTALIEGNINSEPPSGSWSACDRSQSYYYYIIEVPNTFIIGTSHINIFI